MLSFISAIIFPARHHQAVIAAQTAERSLVLDLVISELRALSDMAHQSWCETSDDSYVTRNEYSAKRAAYSRLADKVSDVRQGKTCLVDWSDRVEYNSEWDDEDRYECHSTGLDWVPDRERARESHDALMERLAPQIAALAGVGVEVLTTFTAVEVEPEDTGSVIPDDWED